MKRSASEWNLKASIIHNLGSWFFALFLLAGYFKADPRLAFIQNHIDVTLLFFGLSISVFVYHGFRNLFAIKIPRNFFWMAVLYILLASCLVGGLLYTQGIEYGSDKAIRFISLTGWAFFGGVLLITDFISLRHFLWALLAISATMAIDALLGYQGVTWIGFTNAFGGDHISLGRTCGLGLLTLIVFFLPTEKKLWIRSILSAIAVLLLWAILSSVALGPMLSLILSLIAFFMLSMRFLPRAKMDRFALQLIVVVLFAAIIIASAGQEFFPTLEYRAQNIMAGKDASSTSRLYLYPAAFDLWAKSPILGGGTGQFGVAVTGDDVQAYPHNIIVEVAAETGLLGVLVLIAMIGFAFSNGFIHLCAQEGLSRIVSRYLLVACCFSLLNAMVSYDINGNKMLFTFMGLLTAIQHFEIPEKMIYGDERDESMGKEKI